MSPAIAVIKGCFGPEPRQGLGINSFLVGDLVDLGPVVGRLAGT